MYRETAIFSQRASRPSSHTVFTATAAALLLSSAAIALDAAHSRAQAQALTQDGITWLDTIAVVGTRTETSVQENPLSVSVVDQDEIARKSGESIADMLRDVPGVDVVDDSIPGMKRVSIRGEASRRVTILVDGQEITDHSNYGTPILIDPSNVERIEVVRGPASVLHGAKAIGGVINIITKRGADKPIQAELGGTYYSGTDGWQGWGAVSGTVGDFDYRISGSLDDHGDRRVPVGQYTSTGKLDNSSFGNDYLAAHLGYTFGEAGNHYIALKAEQHRLHTESWTDPSYLTYPIVDFRIDLPKRDRQKVGLYYDGTDISDIVRKVHFDTYYQTVDRLFSNLVVRRPIPSMTVRTASTSDDTNVNYGGTGQMDLQLHPDHYTIVGVNYLMDNLNTVKTSTQTPGSPAPTVNIDDASIQTVSAFAQNEWSFADGFKLTTGARYYYTDTSHDYSTSGTKVGGTDGRLVTSAGLTYTGIENTTLRALYSEGYISPSLVQMFMVTTAGGVPIYGNPNLDPETSRSFEIGARYNAGGLVIDGAAFYTNARDYITTARCLDSKRCPSTGGPSTPEEYINASRATTYGAELMAEYTIPGTALTPYASGAWIRRNLEFDTWSTYNSNTPALSGRLGLRWEGEVANHNAWADLYLRASSKVAQTSKTNTGFDTDELPGWGTLNFAFGGSFGEEDRFSYSVHFNNILNKEYRALLSDLPGVGRSVEASLRMKF